MLSFKKCVFYIGATASKKNEISIRWSSTKSSEAVKKHKQLCGIKKGDKNNEQEKASSSPGGF